MNHLRCILLALTLAAGIRAECGGGMAVVVNKANGTDSLSMPQLRKLMMGDVRSWPDHKNVLVVSREPGSPVFTCMLTAVLRMSNAEYHKYLMGAEFRGEEPPPVRAAGSAGDAVRSVAGINGGITLVEGTLIPQLPPSVKVVRINGKAPGETGYPF
jgi:ABC-type phosphate transport system substrate-binding protein